MQKLAGERFLTKKSIQSKCCCSVLKSLTWSVRMAVSLNIVTQVLKQLQQPAKQVVAELADQ